MHLLHGSETSQFFAESHHLVGRLLGVARVQLEDLHARHALGSDTSKGPLAVSGSLVVVRWVQTGPFEEVELGVGGCFLGGGRAAASNLFSRDGHDRSGVGLRSRLKLK